MEVDEGVELDEAIAAIDSDDLASEASSESWGVVGVECVSPRDGQGSGDEEGSEAGTVAGGTAEGHTVQTTAERLRWEGARAHEDARRRGGEGPLANLRHVLLGCRWREADEMRGGLCNALLHLRDMEWGGDSAHARRQVERAIELVRSKGRGGEWMALEDLLAGFVCNFGWGLGAKERKELGVRVTAGVQTLQGVATEAVARWKGGQAAEMRRRRGQERVRELVRLIVRSWREVADERKSRWPLPTGRRAPEWSAAPAGSQAWVLLEWVRLIGGGRMAERKWGGSRAVREWVGTLTDATLARELQRHGQGGIKGRRAQERALHRATCRAGRERAQVRDWTCRQANGVLSALLLQRRDDGGLWKVIGRKVGDVPSDRLELERAVQIAQARCTREASRQLRWDAVEVTRAHARWQAMGRAHTRECRCARCWALWSPIKADLRGGRAQRNRQDAEGRSRSDAGGSAQHRRAARQLQLEEASDSELPAEQQASAEETLTNCSGGGRKARRGMAEAGSGSSSAADSSQQQRRGAAAQQQDAETTAGDLPGEQQASSDVEAGDHQKRGGDGGSEPGSSGDKRSRRGVRMYVKKAEWLDENRWKSEVTSPTEKVIYFRTNDGEWERRFIIGPSRLGPGAGNGVFAARAFRRGETLTYYGNSSHGGGDLGAAGTEAGEQALRDARAGPAGRYILEINGRYVAANLNSNNPAHMINDAGHKHAKAVCGGGGQVRVKDNATIGAGEEIFWCYGAEYWKYWGPRIELPDRDAGSGQGSGTGRGNGSGRGREGCGRQVATGGETRTTRALRRRVGGRAVGGEGVT